MSSRHGKMRVNVEGDRLSSLPDDLIHKILSFLHMGDAIGTSVLSSRWKFIWTSMPYLNFSTKDFSTLPKFSKFVTNVLSRRNNQAEVYSVKLKVRVKASHEFVKKILNYAFCHNIHQLSLVCLLENGSEFPLSLFSSESLRHLSLKMKIGRSRMYGACSYLTSTWELLALTTLDLHSVILCDDEAHKCVDVFSKCANLKNLTINNFKTKGSDVFSIVHPRLSNLTLENGCLYSVKVVNVTAPHLKNLTVRCCPAHQTISAPGLASFIYEGEYPLDLSTEGFHSLEKARICISDTRDEYAQELVSMLQLLHNVKFLTLNLEAVELLSSSVDLILQQPSPFVNLKSLKIYPELVYEWQDPPTKVTLMSTKLKSYLLDSSPGSTFTMVFREEILAQEIMAELGVILEKEKDNIKINKAHLERGKAKVEIHRPNARMKRKIGGKMRQIKRGWENLGVQLRRRENKACLIISKLEDIEKLLRKLPASKRSELQPCFSSLCAEADIVISQITDYMKIRCDENKSLSRVLFHELATASKPSS